MRHNLSVFYDDENEIVYEKFVVNQCIKLCIFFVKVDETPSIRIGIIFISVE